MKSGESFSRGRYGISPESRISARQKWRFLFQVYLASLVSRWFCLFSRPLRTVSMDSELAWIEKACNTVDFDVVRPLRIPRGYRISGLIEIPGSLNIATFVFRDGAGEQFHMEQRRAWLRLEEEVASAQVPFARTKVKGNNCYIIYGYYGGEPIDHTYWFGRLSAAFEIRGIVVELRDIATTRGGIKLWKLLYFVGYLMKQSDNVAKSSVQGLP